MSEPEHLIIIAQGEAHNVYGPVLPEFGLHGPYLLIGDLLVRDWGPPQITPEEERVHILALVQGMYETFKQPFKHDPSLFEGVFVSYFDESRLIGI